MTAYYEMLNGKLLDAIPASRKVLELGCAAGRLGRRYKELHPDTCWHGVDIHQPSLTTAGQYFDRVWLADLDSVDLISSLEDGYDCVVLGDILEHLKEPAWLLAALHTIITPDARLVCCVPNSAHISIVERLLVGDLSYDTAGLLDRTHLRLFTHSSLFKLLLDTGWLPQLVDQYTMQHSDRNLTATLVDCSKAYVGASQEAAERTLSCYQMIVVCKPATWTGNQVAASISTIVPVDNELQFALNAARSPGLTEISPQIITCRDASTAAEAFEAGRAQAPGEWLLFCHQDAYFPRNFGFALSEALATMPKGAVIGFAGIGRRPDAGTFKAGLVVDRTDLYDWPETDFAVSIDEFAVVLHRDTRLAIDPELGWHLWATDLCLQGMSGRIVRIPVFHNSLRDHTLPPDYLTNAAKLASKYPDYSITTLCGPITPA